MRNLPRQIVNNEFHPRVAVFVNLHLEQLAPDVLSTPVSLVMALAQVDCEFRRVGLEDGFHFCIAAGHAIADDVMKLEPVAAGDLIALERAVVPG